MGAMPSKSDDDLLIVQSHGALERETKDGQEFTNAYQRETVMSEQNLASVTKPKRIIVANFAKIKTEPRALEEYSNEQSPLKEDHSKSGVDEIVQAEKHGKKCQDIEIPNVQLISTENHNISSVQSSKESLGVIFDISPVVSENCLVLNPLFSAGALQNITNIEVKKELLESHVDACASKEDSQDGITSQRILAPKSTNKLTGENYDNFRNVKIEFIEGNSIDEHFRDKNIVLPAADIIKFNEESIRKENSRNKDKEAINQQQVGLQLVKNPFFRKSFNKKRFIKQHQLIEDRSKDKYVNKTIKSELIDSNEESNIAKPLNEPIENSATTELLLDEDTPQPAINHNDLIIKSETSPDDYLDFHVNSNLNINCLSCNLNSSLDVNLSNVDTDFDEVLSTQSIEDVKSNISLNSSRDSLKYYSIIELSSVENGDLSGKKTTIKTTPKTPLKQKSSKSSCKRSTYKARQTGKLQNTNRKKIQKKRGGKPRTKTSKSRRDLSFVSNKGILKNLPKTGIKTRKKTKNTSKTKSDFPKPLKREPQSLHKEPSIATELPKPMMFKSEPEINVRNIKAYLKPEFQPYVRLERLKSEELLVPLKKKPTRKSRQRLSLTQMSNDNRRDFLIHHAFSLSQRTKLNRLSIDHDHSYYPNNSDPPSLYSRLSMPTGTPNESFAEADSKYFSAQELYSMFQSSTPGGSSMNSGHLDSGVSTSTPSMRQPRPDCNKTLLLKIAAERAFINNHLTHFGYSPMQFELLNNLNDLNVFLKYLFGNVNVN